MGPEGGRGGEGREEERKDRGKIQVIYLLEVGSELGFLGKVFSGVGGREEGDCLMFFRRRENDPLNLPLPLFVSQNH